MVLDSDDDDESVLFDERPPKQTKRMSISDLQQVVTTTVASEMEKQMSILMAKVQEKVQQQLSQASPIVAKSAPEPKDVPVVAKLEQLLRRLDEVDDEPRAARSERYRSPRSPVYRYRSRTPSPVRRRENDDYAYYSRMVR